MDIISKKNVLKKLLIIQQNIKVPKNQVNSFGKFNYRSCEDILEQARPLCNDNGAVLILTDDITNDNGRFYIKATATLFDVDSGESIAVTAYARESETKSGMDMAQITGASSSYARKYALSGLFSLDNEKDPDTMDNTANTAGTKTNGKSKDYYINSICNKMQQTQMDNNLITKILKYKYHKTHSKYLTIKELADLDKNIEQYYVEQQEYEDAEDAAHVNPLLNQEVGENGNYTR